MSTSKNKNSGYKRKRATEEQWEGGTEEQSNGRYRGTEQQSAVQRNRATVVTEEQSNSRYRGIEQQPLQRNIATVGREEQNDDLTYVIKVYSWFSRDVRNTKIKIFEFLFSSGKSHF